MSLLTILYGKTRVVIDDKSGSNAAGFKGLIARAKRNILETVGAYAGVVLDCTLSEEHSYQADVTENPVEDGSTIADHVNLKPFTLKIDGLVSDSPLGFSIIGDVQNIVSSITQIFGTQSRSRDAFEALVTLYKNRIPFTVLTNLKRYENMVISEANFPYTKDTGQALDLKMTLTQISIVKSKIIQSSPQTAYKGTVSPTADVGTKVSDTSTVTNSTDNQSVLSSIFN